MSESREDEPRSREDSRRGGKSSDPVADLQGWLIRQGAKSMASQVADNVRRTLGQQDKRRNKGDVWETATTEPPPDEAPECQWCPVCQAARRLRVSGPGLGAKLADAGGVFASVVQDAFAAMEQVMKVPEAKPRPSDSRPEEKPGPPPPRQET